MTRAVALTEIKMLDDFLIRAIIAGTGVALAAGPLGSFLVWNRMAFFGDSLAHSALLGVAIAFIFNVHHILGIVISASVFSLLIVSLQKNRSYSSDTMLGIVAHSALASGLVVVSFFDGIRVNLMSFLFGDILATDLNDIILIYTGLIISLSVLYKIWRPLLLTTINYDMAKVEGVNVDVIRLIFMLLISLLVALSIKIVGILLVTSLLIIPAATARKFSNTPERMVLAASCVGTMSVFMGLYASLKLDTPSGPSIVVCALILFVLSSTIKRA
ncbi:MAG: iron chelate uptake ABC transporter family permease subunit [Rickettsiales bacterium]|nr:iron chelate uptake ABC transporter family permease subunit [Rickettsiales bacterium]